MAWSLSQGEVKRMRRNCLTRTSVRQKRPMIAMLRHAGCKLAYAMALLVGHCMSPYLSGILSVRVDLAWLMILFHHYF